MTFNQVIFLLIEAGIVYFACGGTTVETKPSNLLMTLVTKAFILGDFLGFTASVAADMVLPMIGTKLVGGYWLSVWKHCSGRIGRRQLWKKRISKYQSLFRRQVKIT